MGFRFRKSFKVMPGVRLNISKGGVSTSLGGRGLTANLSKRGIRGTAGLPGTGLSYSTMIGAATKKNRAYRSTANVETSVEHDRVVGDMSGSELQVTGNSSVLTAITVVGLASPLVLASVAAGSFLGWIGWFIALIAFGFVMLSLGRASTDVG